MVTVTQGGLVIGAMSGGYLAGGVAGASVGVGVYSVVASMLSHALTDPKITTELAKGLHLKPGHKEYAPTLAKILNYFGFTPSVD